MAMSSGNVLNPKMSFPHALIISASAGSGKTYTLSQRYAMFLLGDGRHESLPMKPENIIAVTFTNNAAKEMKQRILKYLKDIALGKNDDAPVISAALNMSSAELKRRAAEKVSDLLESYSDFQVQTIDSFFSGIFRLSATELDYSPDIETCFSSDLIIESGVYAVMALAGRPGILDGRSADRFLDNMPKGNAFVWNPAEAMRNAFSGFMAMEASMPYSMAVPHSDARELNSIFEEIKKEYSIILSKVPAEFIRQKMRSLDDISSPIAFIDVYSKGTMGFFDGLKKKIISKKIPDYMTYLGRMDALACRLAEAYSEAYYRPYMEIYWLFREKTEMIKRRLANSIPISDISKKLADYISRNTVPEIYYNLGSRLNHFMIDEFQDTNRLQWNVMLPLIEEALSARGSLFLVGDIKQAIYRFRHADYKIMSSLMQHSGEKSHGLSSSMLPHGIEIENLPVNYRSGGVITSYVEEVFKKKLPALLSYYGLPDFTGLTSYEQQPQQKNKDKGFVKCSIIDVSSEEDSENDYRKCLIGFVKDAMKRHPCRNIAVLVNRNSDVEDTVALLSSEKIPSASHSSLDIRKRPIIAEIISLLKFLDKPYDDLAFFTFINGSIFAKAAMPEGCDLDEQLAMRGRNELLYVFFRKSDCFAGCWNKYFDPLFRKSGYLPLYELVFNIYNSFSLFDNFPDEQAALAKFQQAVSSASSRGINTIGAFIDYAAASRPDEDSKHEFAVALPEALDAVQVMTWHKSKGLGFPVVINIISKKTKPRDRNIGFYEKDGSIYPFYSVAKLENMSDFLKTSKLRNNIEEFVQSLNTMYVICTRAKEEMYNIVLRRQKKSKNVKKTDDLPDFTDLFEPYEAGTLPNAAENKAENVNVSLKASSQKMEKTLMFTPSRPSLPPEDNLQRIRGELLHEVIAEYAKKSAEKNILPIKDVLSSIYDSVYGFYFSEKGIFSKEEDIRLLENFINNDEIKPFFEQKADTETLAEAEFIDSYGNLIRIDLVRISPDCITVVDFKTGAPHTEKYSSQVGHYMRTLERVYSRPTKGYIAYINPVILEEVI